MPRVCVLYLDGNGVVCPFKNKIKKASRNGMKDVFSLSFFLLFVIKEKREKTS
jgi:hypothetical protein